MFDRFGFDSRHTSDKAIEWKQLVDEIKEANRPLCGAIKWLDQPSDPAGHMFVINGFRVDRDGVRWVHVLDPEPTPIPNSDDPDVRRGGSSYWMRFEDFRESSASGVKSGWGGYKHWDDYYAIVEEES